MNMTVHEFLIALFLLACAGFLAVVFITAVTGKVRAWLDRRRKIQCRICGFRFYRDPDAGALVKCRNCGASNKS